MALIFLFGLLIGSFLNVCIHRIPRQESIVFPPSACPACGRRLGWAELVPVFSFLAQKGRCRHCKSGISRRYPLVELLTGAVFALAFEQYGLSMEFLTLTTLASLMTVVAFIDKDYRIIPNRLIMFGLITGIMYSAFRQGFGILPAVLGLAAGFGLLFLVAVLSRGQMGMGDVKLAAVMGAYLGWQGVLLALFLAFMAGAFYGIFLMAFCGRSRKTAIPFGPFLAVASVAAFIWAENIISHYLEIVL